MDVKRIFYGGKIENAYTDIQLTIRIGEMVIFPSPIINFGGCVPPSPMVDAYDCMFPVVTTGA